MDEQTHLVERYKQLRALISPRRLLQRHSHAHLCTQMPPRHSFRDARKLRSSLPSLLHASKVSRWVGGNDVAGELIILSRFLILRILLILRI